MFKSTLIALTLAAVLFIAVAPVDAAPAAALATAESDGLLYMVEEEKLAHDVYLALGQVWGLPLFQNIAAGEQTHVDAIRVLIARYGLSDPTAGLPAGTFVNPTLQALYDRLVAQGNLSLADGLKVGAAIEEIDIRDLNARIAASVSSDVLTVYANLKAGSENHLRAFVSALQQQTGETYQPQYLTLSEYQAILVGNIGRNGTGGPITPPGRSGLGGRR